jgi:hypothetical protein
MIRIEEIPLVAERLQAAQLAAPPACLRGLRSGLRDTR